MRASGPPGPLVSFVRVINRTQANRQMFGLKVIKVGTAIFLNVYFIITTKLGQSCNSRVSNYMQLDGQGSRSRPMKDMPSLFFYLHECQY